MLIRSPWRTALRVMKQFRSASHKWTLVGVDDLNPKQVVTSGPSNPWIDIEITVPTTDRNLEGVAELSADIDEI